MFLMGCSIEPSNDVPTIYEGVVQEKYFQKGTVSTGVGVSTNGQPVVTTHSTSDQYIIFLNGEDYNVPKDVWFSLEKGVKVRYELNFWGIKNIVIVDPEQTQPAETDEEL